MFSNLPKLTRDFPVGLFPHSSQWFEVYTYLCMSGMFGGVEPPRTHSNLSCF